LLVFTLISCRVSVIYSVFRLQVTSYFTSKWKKSDKNGRKCSGKRIPPTANENDNPKGIQFPQFLIYGLAMARG
jgi:hypothetical protein